MNYICFAARASDPAQTGNKAYRLAELFSAGFDVPPFFVVRPEACDTTGNGSTRMLGRQIESALRHLCPDGAPVAVRSSSVEEDGTQHSFAGQFDSFLNVHHRDVCSRVARVWESATSQHIVRYREAKRIGGARPARPEAPAVLVQRMVEAEAAGVAFAADPVNGNPDYAVVTATKGLGDTLVSGDCQGDTWRVNNHNKICSRELSDDAYAALSDRQVRKIAAMARKISEHFGRPQDIEWAISRGRLFLLQSRDITTLASGSADDNYALWDNSNIVESYGGVTTPLTFSVARSAYAEAYRHFGRVIGISERVIVANGKTYEQMIGLHDGRVYYNLLNWYRLLMLTPGFRYNRRFMEQMMGVTQSLPATAVPEPRDDRRFAVVRAALGMLRVSWRLLARLLFHRRRVVQFHNRLSVVLKKVDLGQLSLQQLADYYEDLQASVIPAWDTPLVNDLFCMIFHGALQKLCTRWLPEELADSHNRLVSGEAGIISLEPVRRMQALAGIAAKDPGFVSLLHKAPADEIRQALANQDDFRQAYDEYLDRFGDRCMDELKLESLTLADDPLPMLRTVARMAQAPHVRSSAAASPRQSAEDAVFASLLGRPIKRLLFRAVLGLARARVRDRENLRFERTRVYGRVRSVFVEIGRRLEAREVIESASDIFYLDVDEALRFVHGTSSTIALRGVIAARRDEFAEYRALPDPPRRFMTCGPAQLAESRQAVEPENHNDDQCHRTGQACSAGIARGAVRIVRDPRTADIRAGEILVAQRTDPGWVTIFPLVAGLIMERGSLLSHSAIVARELGLPCVVGVEDACCWLEDGEIVEINGATGSIKRLSRSADSDRAA